jgi:hypothetical protein
MTLGDLHAPGAQARLFLAANQNRTHGLVKRRARQLAAASTDSALIFSRPLLHADRGGKIKGRTEIRISACATISPASYVLVPIRLTKVGGYLSGSSLQFSTIA